MTFNLEDEHQKLAQEHCTSYTPVDIIVELRKEKVCFKQEFYTEVIDLDL